MEIEQSFRVPFPLDCVWHCFHDIEGIVSCLPGASLAAQPENGKLKLGMTVKLGPITAAFFGDGELKLDDSTYSGNITGVGSDRKSGSRVKGEAAFTLQDEQESGQGPLTRVDIRVVYSIAGSLAQFSRGAIVNDLANRMTNSFSDNLKRKLDNDVGALSGPIAVEPCTPSGKGTTSSISPNKLITESNEPLNIGSILWSFFLAQLRKLFFLESG